MTNVTDSTEYAQTLNKGFGVFKEHNNLFTRVSDIYSYRKMDFLFKMLLFTINSFARVNCI